VTTPSAQQTSEAKSDLYCLSRLSYLSLPSPCQFLCLLSHSLSPSLSPPLPCPTPAAPLSPIRSAPNNNKCSKCNCCREVSGGTYGAGLMSPPFARLISLLSLFTTTYPHSTVPSCRLEKPQGNFSLPPAPAPCLCPCLCPCPVPSPAPFLLQCLMQHCQFIVLVLIGPSRILAVYVLLQKDCKLWAAELSSGPA
jgi:hypothetical protein